MQKENQEGADSQKRRKNVFKKVDIVTCGCKIMEQEKWELFIVMELSGETVSREWLGQESEGNGLTSGMRGKNT